MTLLTEVKVPDVGDVVDIDIIQILVQVGDAVEVDQALAVLETDKASMDMPSSVAGIVKAIHINVGDKVSAGVLVATIETSSNITVGVEERTISPPHKTEAPSIDIVEVKVPNVGDVADIDVIEVLIQAGDTVEKEQTLAVLETDKASMDLPSTHSGIVKDVFVKVGDKVSEGTLIMSLKAQLTVVAEQAKQTATAVTTEVTQKTVASNFFAKPAHATPGVRLFARELGVDINQITQGSGRKGRILKEDVKSFVKQLMTSATPIQSSASIPSITAVDFSAFGEIEEQQLSKIQRLTGQHLSRTWLNLPLVTYHDAADITEMEAFRKALNADKSTEIKVTGLIFIIKALVAAMQQFPRVNSSLSPDGQTLILKKYFNIGIAVETTNGLVVPVLKEVDKKNITELIGELNTLSNKARHGKLLLADMQGGCATISSLGGIGGKAFTPIVNAPEVLILGVTRSAMQAIWNGTEFIPRLMLPLDITYDHRVIDGAEGARFMATLIKYLGDIRHLLL